MTQVDADSAGLPGPQHGGLTLFHSFGLVFDLKATDMFTGSDYGTGSGPSEDGGWQFSLALLLVRIGSVAVIPALILALLLGLVGEQQQTAHRRLALGTLYVAIATLMSGYLVSPGVGTGENGKVVLDIDVGPAWWMLVIIIVQVHLTPRTPARAQESSSSRHERT